MRLLLFILLFPVIAQAQPVGYTAGQLVCDPYNGRDHLYGHAVGWDAATGHILIFFGGDGQLACTGSTYPNLGTMDDMDPGTLINDGSGNWNMISPTGAKWMVLFMRNHGNNPGDYANDVAYFFANRSMGFDTSAHERIHIAGGSGGPGRAISWLQNTSVASGNPYRLIFSTAIWMSTTLPTITADYPVPYNMCWYGTADENTGTPPSFTQMVWQNIPGVAGQTKHLKWTVGGTHSNTTWGDCMNIAGSDSSTNRWIWMELQPGYVPPVPENKITGIDTSDMVDLSANNGDPFSFFNEQATADPENNINTAATSVTIPNGRIYWPGFFGFQWRFGVNLRAQYHLKKVWYYVAGNNGFYDDTLFFYKTTDFKSFEQLAAIRIVLNTPSGWYSASLDDTAKWVVIGLKLGKRGTAPDFQFGPPDVRETILYGDMIEGETREAALPDRYTGTFRPKVPIGRFVGVNSINGYHKMFEFKRFAWVRFMNERYYLDDSLQATLIGKKFNGDHFNEVLGAFPGPWRAMRNMFDSTWKTCGLILPEWNGSRQMVINQWGGNLGWPINNLGDDPLNPSSYTHSGYMFWNLAAHLGSVAIDSNRLSIYRTPRYTGQGMNVVIGNGSEVNGSWRVQDTATSGWKYENNYQYMVRSQVDYDGWENQFGDSIGLANADPNMKLGCAADYEINPKNARSRIMLSRAMRSDNKNIFSMYQFNHYEEKNYPGIGLRGVHALAWDMSKHVEDLVDQNYRLDPTMKNVLTENGFDANTLTPKAIPPRTGTTWTNRQWQAINIVDNIVAASKTHLDGYTIYVMSTNAEENHGGTFQNSDIMANFPSTVYKDPYYYVSNFIDVLYNYRHEATIQSQWRGIWMEKYRNINSPDSVAFIAKYADTTGETHDDQLLDLVGINGTVKKVELSFTSFNNTESNVDVEDGQLTMDLGEKHVIFLATEAAEENQLSNRRHYFRGSLRNKFRN